MKLARLFIVVFGLTAATLANAEITSIGDAINKAGRQRMLTQRMLLSYSMVGIDVQPDVARDRLRGAMALFQSQLNELKNYPSNDNIKKALIKVDSLWVGYKAALLTPVTKHTAQKLLEMNGEILRAAHKVVLLLEDMSGTTAGRLVNISGRQRMLSQRLAMFYMLRVWGFDNAELRSGFEQAKNEFKGALDELSSSELNSPKINAELKEAKKEWDLYEHGLKRGKDNFIPLIVAMSAEKLLVRMNTITGMYAELPAR